MNLFVIRLPYFSACCFSLYLISIFESDPIPDTQYPLSNTYRTNRFTLGTARFEASICHSPLAFC
jgi:hypothetical protein